MDEYSEEKMKVLLDACDRAKSSYAEERTAQTLDDFLKRYEKDQKAQAKENQRNHFYAVASLWVGIFTLAATIIFGLLQVLH